MAPKAKSGARSPARASSPAAKVRGVPSSKAKAKSGAAAPISPAAPEEKAASASKATAVTEAEIVACFKTFDVNGDGKISLDELHDMVKFLDATFDEDTLHKLLKEADTNEDGRIDYTEFVAWVMKDGEDAKLLVTQGSDMKVLQKRLDLCLLEAGECEAAASAPKPVEKWFERDDNVGMSYGKADEGKSNVVTRISKDGMAYRQGVCLGWVVVRVGDRPVTGRSYVPDMIMEARRTGGVKVGFVTPDALKNQRVAEDLLPGLWAAVDLAKAALEAASKPPPEPDAKVEVVATEPEPSKAEPEPKTDEPEVIADPSMALAIYTEKNMGGGYMPTYGELMVAMGCADDKKDEIKDNPYQILHVAYTATQEEIKKAFMFLARMYHPDKYPEDPRNAKYRFDRIKKAYDQLRTEEVRAEVDFELVRGGMDLLSLYAADPKRAAEKMIKVPAHLDIDPDANPGVNSALKEKGSAVIQYYDYKMPFPVPDGVIAASDIDNVYGLSDSMPGCQLFLAEWRKGRTHIFKHGEFDSGDSALLKKEKDKFSGLEAGYSYFLIVQESEEVAKKDEALKEFHRKAREAAENATKIVHKCEDEQIYVFGLGSVCRVCSDKDAAFR